MISIIAALARDNRPMFRGDYNVIGYKNKLPWHLPVDLKRFQKLTKDKVVVMGRKTYESIGQPLKDRHLIVVSSKSMIKNHGCISVKNIEDSLPEANRIIKELSLSDEIMFAGGASLYQEIMPYTSRLYLTFIHEHFKADAYFFGGHDLYVSPEHSFFDEIYCDDFTATKMNPYDYSFGQYDRRFFDKEHFPSLFK